MWPASWTSLPDPMAYLPVGEAWAGVSGSLAGGSLLRDDPQRYLEMVRGVSAFGIHLIDCHGRIRSWNRGAINLTGLSESEVLGQPFSALFPEDQRQAGVPQRLLQYVRAQHHCRGEQRRRRHGEEDFLALCTLDALRRPSGELIGFVEVFQDVTEQKQREDGLRQQVTRDPLTGAYNRGCFTERAVHEIERARQFAEPLSLILVDVDHFKRLNVSHGRDIGDRVLMDLARILSQACRSLDFCGRLGGGRFALLLPRADKEPALDIAHHLRARIGERRLPSGGGRRVSYAASMGVASLRSTVRDLPGLLRSAEAALHKAKRSGRNRVEAWFE